MHNLTQYQRDMNRERFNATNMNNNRINQNRFNPPPSMNIPLTLKNNINIEKINDLVNNIEQKVKYLKENKKNLQEQIIKSNNDGKLTREVYDQYYDIIQQNVDVMKQNNNIVNEYKAKLNTLDEYLDKINQLSKKAIEHSEKRINFINNEYLKGKGKLSQLALATLPKDEATLRKKIVSSLEDTEGDNTVDKYMTVYNLEKNKYNPRTRSTTLGGRKKTRKFRHKKSKKVKR